MARLLHRAGKAGQGRAAAASLSLASVSSSLVPGAVAWVSPPSPWPRLHLPVTRRTLRQAPPPGCSSASRGEGVGQVWAPGLMSCTRWRDRREPAGCQADPVDGVHRPVGMVTSASWARVSTGQHVRGPQPRLMSDPGAEVWRVLPGQLANPPRSGRSPGDQPLPQTLQGPQTHSAVGRQAARNGGCCCPGVASAGLRGPRPS